MVYGTRVPAERRWARSAREAAPALLALALSPVVAAVAPGPRRPLARMRGLIDIERRLGLFFEPAGHPRVDPPPPPMREIPVTHNLAHVAPAPGGPALDPRAH